MLSYKGEPFSRRASLAEIFQRERRKGAMDFEVIYSRNGVESRGEIYFHSAEDRAAMTKTDGGNPLENVVVMSHWSVRLPKSGETDGSAKATRPADGDSIRTGDRVVSVNGIQVGNENAISAVLRLSMDPSGVPELPVDLGVKRQGTDDVTELQVALPIIQDTVLGNGLRFETMHDGRRWQTTLVDIPEGVETDMEIGDKMLAYGTGEPLSDRMSLAKMIENDRRKGMAVFDFFVDRDGQLEKCYLGYPS